MLLWLVVVLLLAFSFVSLVAAQKHHLCRPATSQIWQVSCIKNDTSVIITGNSGNSTDNKKHQKWTSLLVGVTAPLQEATASQLVHWQDLNGNTASLHWQNTSNNGWVELQQWQWQGWKVKQQNNTRKPPEGSWWMKVPLCCVPVRVYTVFQGQEYFHSC